MPNCSSKTTVIAIRLPNNIVQKVNERIEKRAKYITISQYLRERIIYDITRKHNKMEVKNDEREQNDYPGS